MGAEAAAFAGFPLLYPEQLNDVIQPHFASEVWFMGMLGHAPNCYVDISSTIQKKADAIGRFETTISIITDLFGFELSAEPGENEAKKLTEGTDQWIRAMAEKTGKEAGLKAAEAFYIQKCLPGHFDHFKQDTGLSAPGQAGSPIIL
jgi:hypothetical protein